MDEGDEIFDVVDAGDRVIGRATRREVHAKSLLHRSVHIMVFDPAGNLFLQKRVLTKDENPGLWDTSCAGHVGSGEDYLASARRELEEELGITGSLQLLMRIPAGSETLWEHVRVYTCTTDQPISINPKEISEGRFWSLKEVENALGVNEEWFTSTFKIIFNSFLNTRRRA